MKLRAQLPVPLTEPGLAAVSGVRHGFFTRHGGVSGGVYASLNCGFGSDDSADNVAANRARAAAALDAPATALLTARQVHGTAVAEVSRAWPRAAAPRADGMITRVPGVMLGVSTADCAPVLFADALAGVVGAAHAGWRGAKAGVLEATVDAMVALGAHPRRIVAAVGPCIAQPSYEVGAELRAAFREDAPDNDDFFAPAARAGHYLFDLPGFVNRRLGAIGLGAVGATGGDSCAEADRFFSYRRAHLDAEADFGRGLSAIVLTA